MTDWSKGAAMIRGEIVPIGDVNPARYRRVAEVFARLGMAENTDVPP